MKPEIGSPLLALFLAASSLVAASGKPQTGFSFEDLAKSIEQHYGVRRTRIPLMGLTNLVTKAARPAGTTGFRLALFENLRDHRNNEGLAELDQLMSQQTAGGLRPVVRTHSSSGEATYIYAADGGHTVKLLIATFDREEATLIEIHVQPGVLLELLQSPDHAAAMFRVRND